MTTKQYPRIFLGYHSNEKVYLEPPSFSSTTFWTVGWLHSKHSHTTVRFLEADTTNLHEGFKAHFGDTLTIPSSELWGVCELFNLLHIFQKLVSIYNVGHSGYTYGLTDLKNHEERDKLNQQIIPVFIDKLYDILLNKHQSTQTKNA